jgi:hypothetical protein
MRDLDDLLGELLSDPAYASGRRAFPRTVTAGDAVALAALAGSEVDRGAAAREQAAARDGVRLACARGCTGCCEELVLVYAAEAERIAAWLARPENARAREAFLARLPEWRRRVGDAGARLADLVARGDDAGYQVAHVAQWRRRILCAFNVEGDCAIYEVRPVACRNAHAVDTAEHCVGDDPSGKSAVRLAFKPLDDFLARVRQLERATHHALGGQPRRPEPLCEAVARRLSLAG